MGWLRSILGRSPARLCSREMGNLFRRSLRAEPLEPRHLMAVNVFLDFGDASGANSFADRLQELAGTDGRLPFSTAETDQLKTSIANAVQTAFTGYDLTFSQTQPSGDF